MLQFWQGTFPLMVDVQLCHQVNHRSSYSKYLNDTSTLYFCKRKFSFYLVQTWATAKMEAPPPCHPPSRVPMFALATKKVQGKLTALLGLQKLSRKHKGAKLKLVLPISGSVVKLPFPSMKLRPIILLLSRKISDHLPATQRRGSLNTTPQGKLLGYA